MTDEQPQQQAVKEEPQEELQQQRLQEQPKQEEEELQQQQREQQPELQQYPSPQPHPSPKQQITSSVPQNPPPPPQQHPSHQENGDSRVSDPASNAVTPKPEPEPDSDMASHRPPALHGLHAGYATSSPSSIYTSQSSLPTTQYASYPTVSAQQGDPYRVSPVGTPQMSLPSMRTIDAMSQQSVPPMPHHSMSMSMSMPLTSVSPTPPYFTSHSPLPSNYGFPQDALARYPLPHDPRLINHRGPKKVCLFFFTTLQSCWRPIGPEAAAIGRP